MAGGDCNGGNSITQSYPVQASWLGAMVECPCAEWLHHLHPPAFIPGTSGNHSPKGYVIERNVR